MVIESDLPNPHLRQRRRTNRRTVVWNGRPSWNLRFDRKPRSYASMLAFMASAVVLLGSCGTPSVQHNANASKPMAQTGPTAAKPQPEPLVGLPFGPGQAGFGKSRPTRIYGGGSPAGLIEHITWTSYGGATATGTGRALYIPKSGYVATAKMERTHIEATDLGKCQGVWIYRAVRWTFPRHHGGSYGEFMELCSRAREYGH